MDRSRWQRPDFDHAWLEVAAELEIDPRRAAELLTRAGGWNAELASADRATLRELLRQLDRGDPTEAIAPGRMSRLEAAALAPASAGKRTRIEAERELHQIASGGIDAAARGAGASGPATAGRPLPESIRRELEGALGVDLGGVEIHDDAASAAAARALGAKAFTRGQRIVFAERRFDPASSAGRRLLAHEVAHVAQSSGAPATPASTSSAGDAHERSAEAFADAFASGSPMRSTALSPAIAASPSAASAVVHLDPDEQADGEQSHEDQLREIQAMQMSSLLPAIEALPADVKTDYEAAHVGGPRLKAAMYAVNEKGAGWKAYITGHNDVAGHLPVDQLDAIMGYLGGPEGQFRFYKDVGNFDGSVEPGGDVTLYCRIRFYVTEGTNLSGLPPAGTEWVRATEQAVAQFGQRFIERIGESWGAANATITCAATSVDPLTTKVQVSVVDAGEHAAIQLVPGGPLTAMHGDNSEGTWSIGDNDERETAHGHKQIGSVHEFGHIIGVSHPDTYEELVAEYNRARPGTPAKKEAERKLYAWQERYKRLKVLAEYGDTPEEQANIMGHGDRITTIGGDDPFDPFTPFQEIAKKWGEEFIVDPKLNEWSTG